MGLFNKKPQTPRREDIEAAAARMPSNLGIRREIDELEDKLLPGESVSEMSFGSSDGRNGLLVATNLRLLYVRAGLGGKGFQSIPIKNITDISVQQRGLKIGLSVSYSGGSSDWSSTTNGNSIQKAVLAAQLAN